MARAEWFSEVANDSHHSLKTYELTRTATTGSGAGLDDTFIPDIPSSCIGTFQKAPGRNTRPRWPGELHRLSGTQITNTTPTHTHTVLKQMTSEVYELGEFCFLFFIFKALLDDKETSLVAPTV